MPARGAPAVLAIGAHPDDVEIAMAGTLILLGRAGASLHIWSITDGSLGSPDRDGDETARVRAAEAAASASLAGAILHPPAAPDMGLFYSREMLARAGAVIREVRPRLMLVPSPEDYHPDHEAACRLSVSAALVRSIPAFETDPPVKPWGGDTSVYHAMPHGLRDPMGRKVKAGHYVDVTDVMDLKRGMLLSHASQVEMLAATQGEDYVDMMERACREIGSSSGLFEYAEGWRRHAHTGLSLRRIDPLSEMLGTLCHTDPAYEESLG